VETVNLDKSQINEPSSAYAGGANAEIAEKPETSSEENTSGRGKHVHLPAGVSGWSWGAFFLNVFWAIGNKTWIGLLCFIPYVGIAASFYLGFHGRELAWQNKRWESVEHFNRVQKKWSCWGIGITVFSFCLGMLSAFLIPDL
jgi:hypothetical protein